MKSFATAMTKLTINVSNSEIDFNFASAFSSGTDKLSVLQISKRIVDDREKGYSMRGRQPRAACSYVRPGI